MTRARGRTTIPKLEAEIRALVEAGHDDFVAEIRRRHPDLTYADFHIAASRAFRALGIDSRERRCKGLNVIVGREASR
jgi:hypothetical protein